MKIFTFFRKIFIIFFFGFSFVPSINSANMLEIVAKTREVKQLVAEGQYDVALQIKLELISLMEEKFGKDHHYYGFQIADLGHLHLLLHNNDMAEFFLKQTEEIVEKKLGPEAIRLSDIKILIGNLYYSQGRYGEANKGPLALPGNYSVSMHQVVDGTVSLLVDKTPFSCVWLDKLSTPTDNKEELLTFQVKVDKLRKAVDASGKVLVDLNNRLSFIKSAVKSYPNLDSMGSLKFTVSKIKEVSSDIAFLIGEYYLKRSPEDSNGHFTLLWKKINGQWLIISDHTSAVK